MIEMINSFTECVSLLLDNEALHIVNIAENRFAFH